MSKKRQELKVKKCPVCKGHKTIIAYDCSVPCNFCEGTGRVIVGYNPRKALYITEEGTRVTIENIVDVLDSLEYGLNTHSMYGAKMF